MGLSFRKHLGSSAGFNSGGLSNRGGGGLSGLSTALHQWSWQYVSIVGTTMTATDFGSIGGLDLSNPDASSLPSIDNVNKCIAFGSGEYLKRAVTNFRMGDTKGTIHVYAKLDEASFAQYFLASTDGSTLQYAGANSANYYQQFFLNDGGSNIRREDDGYTGFKVMSFVQDDSSLKILINGVEVSAYSFATLGSKWYNNITSNVISWNALIRTTVSAPAGKQKYIGYCTYVSTAQAQSEALEILNSLP